MDALTANASVASLHLPAEDRQINYTSKIILTISALLIPLLGHYLGNRDKAYSGIPFIGKERGEWSNKFAKARWATDSVGLVRKGMEEVC